MNIREIRAAAVKNTAPLGRDKAKPAAWGNDHANPMARYPEFSNQGPRFAPPWSEVICVVTAEDGTWGMGMTSHSGPVVTIINDYFAPLLVGENVFATERMWNLMVRCANAHFGVSGLASYAVSAVDLALWDLKGKLLGHPVYELLGGPARERMRCYATGVNIENFLELGFEAIKLDCQWGSSDSRQALRNTENMVSDVRELVGDEVELMLDLWAVQETQHTIELGERLRPYGLKWFEDFAYSEDWRSYQEVRSRLPGQALAAGERWYTDRPFQHAAQHRVVDIFQPDILWVGGVTASMKIAAIAESAGLEIAVHLGCNDAYGQHVCHALPGNRWAEMFFDTAPGESLMNSYRATPGMALPVNGYLVPSDAPGFGIEITLEGIEAAT